MNNMEKTSPALVIMAAGMGSRYGGLKQMDPVGLSGELIMDFSIYDAMRAGFSKVVFVIKQEMEKEFRAMIENKAARHIRTEFVTQSLGDIPRGFSVPDSRQKPWGTAHAVLCARDCVKGPFAVINADDFYGAHAFKETYDFLSDPPQGEGYPFCMVCYDLENTLSETGYVSRGVCRIDADGNLAGITERVHIEKEGDRIFYMEGDGSQPTELFGRTPVSMNLWGFSREMMGELSDRFAPFLEAATVENPLKAEYFLPSVVNELLQERKAFVRVKRTPDRWYGMTNKEDKPAVSQAICAMQRSGMYPLNLWG